MSVTAYPTLRLKLTVPQALKVRFLPAIPGTNAGNAAAAAEAAAAQAIAAAAAATAATAGKVDKAGDVMTGHLTLSADPTASLHAATKHYVDILGTSGILEAPNDGVLYGRQSLAWAAAQPLNGNLTSLAAATATNAIYYRSAANTWATVTIGSNLTFTGGTLAATGGGGGGAPTTAEYITSASDATLSAERVLTNTASITWDFSTPGQAKANTAAGGGNVSTSGTPTVGQYGKWVTATTIQGVAVGTVLTDIGAQPLDTTLTALAAYNTNGLLTQTAADTFTGRTLTGPAAGIAVTNGNGVSGNPTLALANDLAALEALAGTNNIYYRAGADTWSSVTIGSGLTFTGGTLNATGGAGITASSTPQGRLTLVPGTPVMTANPAAANPVYYTPYVGDQISLYDGTNMVPTTFAELACATTDTTKNPAALGVNKVNDWFVWNDASTIRLCHGPDWTNDTTRSAGTALVRVKGLWLNNASITNACAAQRGTYVGTTRTDAGSTPNWIYGELAANGTAGFFGVWNAYNRVLVGSTTGDTSDSWTYNSGSAAWRAANTSNTMRCQMVRGLNEDAVLAQYTGFCFSTTGAFGMTGVGVDSTTAFTGTTGYRQSASVGTAIATYNGCPGLGFHYVQAIEYSAGGTSTSFLGDHAWAAGIIASGLNTLFKA